MTPAPHAAALAQLTQRFPDSLHLSRRLACSFLQSLFTLQAQRPPASGGAACDGVAVILINLDHFQKVNEAHGYLAADGLLDILQKRIGSVLDADMTLHRLQGAEFLLTLPGAVAQAEVREVAELVGEMLRFPIDLDDGRRAFSGSLGISLFPDDGKSGAEILRNAEVAMHEARTRGRNRHCFFRRQHYDILQERLSLERDLVEALADDQLLLYYEPRVDLPSDRFCGMEALVRWRHPQRGLVPPLEFIYLAEQTGQINRLGQIVFEKAVRQAAAWRDAGIPPVPISVNLSAFQLTDRDLLPFIDETLAQHGIAAQGIDIELTESAAVSADDSAASEQLQQLRSRGFRLMIDDFGTGFSSLGQLQQLRPDVLKIDKSFTATLTTSADGKVFVAAIISMAHALSMRVIAEGCETLGQVQQLRALGCDEIQGYLLARPMPADQMTILQQQPLFPQIHGSS